MVQPNKNLQVTQVKTKRCFLSHLTAFEECYPSKLWLALSLLWGLALYPAFINGIAILWSIILCTLLVLYMRKSISERFLSFEIEKKSGAGYSIILLVCAHAMGVILYSFALGLFFILPDINVETNDTEALIAAYLHMKFYAYNLEGTLDYRVLGFLFSEREAFYFEETLPHISDPSFQYFLLYTVTALFLFIMAFVFVRKLSIAKVDPHLMMKGKTYLAAYDHPLAGITFNVVFLYLAFFELFQCWVSGASSHDTGKETRQIALSIILGQAVLGSVMLSQICLNLKSFWNEMLAKD